MPRFTTSSSVRQNAFGVTQWSVVIAAGGKVSPTVRRAALERLAQTYWFPLYAYIRRHAPAPGNCSAEHAADLTQAFFAKLLETDAFAGVDRAKGKFRSFLLAALKHFMSNEFDKQRAQKRGGGRRIISLDAADAEARYRMEPVDDMTPQRLFDRRWALAVLEQVFADLRADYRQRDQAAVFEQLKDSLAGPLEGTTYAQIGERLGMTESAVKVAAHRMRQRYRRLLHDHIAQTLDNPPEEEVRREIEELWKCL
ncbi:MAG: sigma-70 family RNA polymerase sigma factor [Phycisphaeraceae bacterium]